MKKSDEKSLISKSSIFTTLLIGVLMFTNSALAFLALVIGLVPECGYLVEIPQFFVNSFSVFIITCIRRGSRKMIKVTNNAVQKKMKKNNAVLVNYPFRLRLMIIVCMGLFILVFASECISLFYEWLYPLNLIAEFFHMIIYFNIGVLAIFISVGSCFNNRKLKKLKKRIEKENSQNNKNNVVVVQCVGNNTFQPSSVVVVPQNKQQIIQLQPYSMNQRPQQMIQQQCSIQRQQQQKEKAALPSNPSVIKRPLPPNPSVIKRPLPPSPSVTKRPLPPSPLHSKRNHLPSSPPLKCSDVVEKKDKTIERIIMDSNEEEEEEEGLGEEEEEEEEKEEEIIDNQISIEIINEEIDYSYGVLSEYS